MIFVLDQEKSKNKKLASFMKVAKYLVFSIVLHLKIVLKLNGNSSGFFKNNKMINLFGKGDRWDV